MNYETIKLAAKRAKIKVNELLALSPGNDPFYCGSPGQLEKAKWFGEIYDKMGRPDNVHVRRVHYWLVSQDPKYKTPNGEDYLNNDKCWGLISISSKYARYAGLVPMENIVDRRNPPAIENCYNWEHRLPSDVKDETDSSQIINLISRQFYCFNASKTQPYMLELWCEKSTMNDVLEPICKEHGMNLVTGLGELSITAVRLLMDRVISSGKPTRIFYISDFDPAGEGMPISVSRKIEYFTQKDHLELDIKLIPIMLTSEQCVEYELPRTPIKSSNLRKNEFEERHGSGATELDALEALYPGRMHDLIINVVDEYFDHDKWNLAVRKNRSLREKVEEHLTPMVTNLLENVDLTEFDDFDPGEGSLIDDNDRQWLYDSRLKYFDQLMRYKNHKSA
ncbi:MAG: hypothetical protein AAF348_18760 [Bacteroidota bacterium]